MMLLANSADFPIFSITLLLFPPGYPISLKNVETETAGNPLHPTSRDHILILQPFDLPS